MDPYATTGQMKVYALYDGPLPTTLDRIPDDAHRAMAQSLIKKAGADALVMNVYAFLITCPAGKYLVDAGTGKLKGDELGRVREQLERYGVRPADIDAVFMTHLHLDHFGGLIGENAPAFPNAEIIIHRREAEFWLDTPDDQLPVRVQRGLGILRGCMTQYKGRIRYVDQEEVHPGIRAIPAYGHSHGHVCWQIGAGENAVLAWGDLIHIAAIHLSTPRIAFDYDLDPAEALESRLRILNWVADSGLKVAGAHLPAPGLGLVKRQGDAFRFEVLKLASQ